jgi:hypothetical protein
VSHRRLISLVHRLFTLPAEVADDLPVAPVLNVDVLQYGPLSFMETQMAVEPPGVKHPEDDVDAFFEATEKARVSDEEQRRQLCLEDSQRVLAVLMKLKACSIEEAMKQLRSLPPPQTRISVAPRAAVTADEPSADTARSSSPAPAPTVDASALPCDDSASTSALPAILARLRRSFGPDWVPELSERLREVLVSLSREQRYQPSCAASGAPAAPLSLTDDAPAPLPQPGPLSPAAVDASQT